MCVEREPVLFKTLRKWFNVVKDIKFNDPKKQAKFEALEVEKLKDEVFTKFIFLLIS